MYDGDIVSRQWEGTDVQQIPLKETTKVDIKGEMKNDEVESHKDFEMVDVDETVTNLFHRTPKTYSKLYKLFVYVFHRNT